MGILMQRSWLLKVALVIALVGVLAVGAMAATRSGGSSDGSAEYTDLNPGYSELGTFSPGEEEGGVLYTIALSEPIATSYGSGDIFTVTLTAGDALIEDMVGNITVTGVPYAISAGWMQQWTVLDDATYGNTTAPGVIGIIEFDNITLHPGGEISFQFPVQTYMLTNYALPYYDPVGHIWFPGAPMLLTLKAEYIH